MAEKGGAASLTTAIRVGEGDRGYDMRKKNPAFLEHLKEVITKVGTQAKVAKEISASGSRIPEWNAGKRLPSADTLIRLGRVALEHSASDPFYFWALAGIDPQTLKSMASKVVEWEEEVAGPTIPIRRYRQTLEGREESGPPVSLPSEFVPRPRQTVCLDVDGAIGSDVLEAPRGSLSSRFRLPMWTARKRSGIGSWSFTMRRLKGHRWEPTRMEYILAGWG